MNYEKECPYCHSKVQKMTIPYSQEYQIYGYHFWCDCRNERKDERDNEEEAYRVYLQNRG